MLMTLGFLCREGRPLKATNRYVGKGHSHVSRPLAGVFLGWTASLLVASAVAQPVGFIAKLNEKFPTTVGAAVAPAFPNFWSVVKNGEVLFIKDDLSILINGDVVDLNANRSLSAALREANPPKIPVTDLDPRDAIKFGEGSRRLYVFADPDCTFCRQLEPELAKLKDVQIYVFEMPLTTLHPNADAVAESIWCAPDRAAAWRKYLLTGGGVRPVSCANPLERNLALGQRLNIRGTPALVFEDGSLIPGAITADRIEALLRVASSVKAVAAQ